MVRVLHHVWHLVFLVVVLSYGYIRDTHVKGVALHCMVHGETHASERCSFKSESALMFI